MRALFKKYAKIVGIIQLVTATLLGGLSIWYGAWYPDAQSNYHEKLKTDNQAVEKPGFFETSWEAFSWKSPVPYTAIALLLTVVSGFGVVLNGVRLEDLEKQASDFGVEQIEHAETRKYYYDALRELLVRVLSAVSGFDGSCRISVYRHDPAAKMYRMVFRHCDINRYESKGRVSIPQDEGVLGAIYMNGEYIHLCDLPEKKGKAQIYCRELNKKLQPYSVEIAQGVIDRIRMPSRCYLGYAIQVGQDKKYAIAIFESINPRQFDERLITDMLRKENSEIGRYIRYITTLDRKLNPYGSAP